MATIYLINNIYSPIKNQIIMNEELKKAIIERVKEAKTKAGLAAVKAAMVSALMQTEAEQILKIKDKRNRDMAFLNAITAERHEEISEENRQQWKQDRVGMWEEAANTCTPQTIATILFSATERGIIESYTVNVSNGEVLKGSRQ